MTYLGRHFFFHSDMSRTKQGLVDTLVEKLAFLENYP